MTKNNDDKLFILQLLIALGSLGFFSLMFVAMHYYELIGSDNVYFDEGTIQNLKYINMLTSKFGLDIDPAKPHKITTLGYSICMGLALFVSGGAIMLANRRGDEVYETTDAV